MKRRTIFRLAAGAFGAVAGFAYYHYVGCASGTCPITGNPWVSTIYGAAVGALAIPSDKKPAEERVFR